MKCNNPLAKNYTLTLLNTRLALMSGWSFFNCMKINITVGLETLEFIHTSLPTCYTSIWDNDNSCFVWHEQVLLWWVQDLSIIWYRAVEIQLKMWYHQKERDTWKKYISYTFKQLGKFRNIHTYRLFAPSATGHLVPLCPARDHARVVWQ